MFTKVIVGVVAAIAVAGAGIYIAMPDSSSPCCSQKQAIESENTSECRSCCGAKAACLAACTGSIALISTTSAKSAGHACCSEE
jgi:hypothetical protein